MGWRAAAGAGGAGLVVGLVLLAALLLLRAGLVHPPPAPTFWAPRATAGPAFDEQELVRALRGAIKIPTVAFLRRQLNTTALIEFGKYIQKVFPAVFSTEFIQHEVVGEYSYLFTVQGSDPQLMPYMLLAHMDVVPASEEGWKFPPFSAEEDEGYIYGRGTLDNKNSAMGILQALEFLLRRNYRPRRSFYIGIGHDEEVSGLDGGKQIAMLLQARGVKLSFLLDEGSGILDGVIEGITSPVALIAVTEKGLLTLNLTVRSDPGHSSAPPKETSIGILAAAVSRLEKNPMPRLFGYGPELMMFEHLASEFTFPLNIIMKNLWLFSPLVSRIIERKPTGNSMVRTTTALTIFKAGIKFNVVPHLASAAVNFRIHPAQKVAEVLEIVKDTIDDDRVEITVTEAFDPLPISPWDDQALGVQIFRRTIMDVFPNVSSIAPGVCIGNTDSRHFTNLTDAIYRFNPVVLKADDVSRIHGWNERISVKGYEKQVEFLFQLIQNSDIDKLPKPHLSTHEL